MESITFPFCAWRRKRLSLELARAVADAVGSNPRHVDQANEQVRNRLALRGLNMTASPVFPTMYLLSGGTFHESSAGQQYTL